MDVCGFTLKDKKNAEVKELFGLDLVSLDGSDMLNLNEVEADWLKWCSNARRQRLRENGRGRFDQWDCVEGDMESFAQKRDWWRMKIKGETGRLWLRFTWKIANNNNKNNTNPSHDFILGWYGAAVAARCYVSLDCLWILDFSHFIVVLTR